MELFDVPVMLDDWVTRRRATLEKLFGFSERLLNNPVEHSPRNRRPRKCQGTSDWKRVNSDLSSLAGDPPHRMYRLRHILITHCFLALMPVLAAFVEISEAPLPMLWCVLSILLGQLMLLAVFVGLFPGSILARFLPAAAIVASQSLFNSRAEFSTNDLGLPTPFLETVGRNFILWMSVFVLLCIVAITARACLGRINDIAADDQARQHANKKSQYSLFGIMAVISCLAVSLAFFRDWDTVDEMLRFRFNPHFAVLLASVLSINMLIVVWATLTEKGRLDVRLFVTFFAAAVLGVFVQQVVVSGFGGLSRAPWTPLLTVLATCVMVVTLLAVRKHGYRLVPPNRRADEADNDDDTSDPLK